MKKFSLFALAAAGMLLGACSDKEEVTNGGGISEDFSDGAYIGISLSLPSADNTTRANDSLNNGSADEFAVRNATLYIFKLATSSTENPDEKATYVNKVSLGNTYEADKQGAGSGNWEIQDPKIGTNITSTYSEATLIPNALASEIKTDNTNTYYAYVIVNHNGQVPTSLNTSTTFAEFSKSEFSVIGADIAAEKNIWATGLLMTNAPICDKSGGSAAPAESAKYSTLVKLDKTKIFGSAAEAKAAPAACVYVERAAVKITVVDGRGDSPEAINGYDVAIAGWQVINYEKTYYNTRQINNNGASSGTTFEDWGRYCNEGNANTTTKYRFVSLYPFFPTKPSEANHTTGYRTYFAQDPHYATDAQAANLTASPAVESTLGKTVASPTDWITVNKHAYTTENTFDVAHQTWRNTTMVTLKATLSKTEGGSTTTPSFYTVGKGSQVMYVTAETAKAAIENYVKGDNDVASKLEALRTKISQNNTNKTVTSGLTVSFTEPTAGKTDVDFTIGLDYKLENAAYTEFNGTDEGSLKTELETAIQNVIKVDHDNNSSTDKVTADPVLLSYYKEGVSYYNVRIKHFGEFETPWSATGAYVSGGGSTINEIYGTDVTARQNNFLGRYGVVRDNWYKLSIDKISKIGTAEPVDPSTTTPDTPDDEIENYISVHVHIVPWVLREQKVEL